VQTPRMRARIHLLWFAPRATITARFSDHVTGYQPSKSRETGWHVTLRTALRRHQSAPRPTPHSAVISQHPDPHRTPPSSVSTPTHAVFRCQE
jgi:hypothetical protein